MINPPSEQSSLGPLDGVKVVDLTKAVAGPYAAMMLGDLGADVIKVEPPETGDEARQWGPPFLDNESSYFLSVNRNKRSIGVNLKSEDGRSILFKLIERADVFLENFKPGTTIRLKIDYGTFRRINPRLLYCSISGFGQDGPYVDRPGYDIVAFAMGGIMSITGEAGRPPVKMGVPVADIGAGMFAAYGIVAALLERQKSGRGQHIDVSLLDSQVSWLTYQAGYYFATGKNPERLGSAHSTIAPYQAFKAKDGYFMLAIGNDEQWKDFCDALDLEELKVRPQLRTNPARVRNRIKLERLLQRIFIKKKVENWLSILEKAGVPSGPVNTISDVFRDPQVLHRKMLQKINHPKIGSINVVGIPVKFSATPGAILRAPPMLAEHTEEILTELGYTGQQVKELRARKAIG